MQAKSIVRAAIVLAAFATGAAFASNASAASEPIVIAQATMAVTTSGTSANLVTYPSIEAGVRAAAIEGSVALRRYVTRTRMIYAWNYDDFALQ